MTFLTSLPVLQPCQRSSTLSSAAFSSCSWFVKCEPSRNEYITLSMWKNTSCKTSEKSLPGAENFHLTLEISRAKLHDHTKSLSKGDESLGHIWNQNFPTRSLFFFSLSWDWDTHLLDHSIIFRDDILYCPFSHTKGKAGKIPDKGKNLYLCCCLKRDCFLLDENIKDVYYQGCLFKQKCHTPKQGFHLCCFQNLALCSATKPCAVVAFRESELCGFSTEPRML